MLNNKNYFNQERFNSKAIIRLTMVALGFLFPKMAAAEVAPEFSLPLLDKEKTVSLADFKGQVVYLDFWASWCGPCAVSLPELEKLRAQFHNKGFEVVAINLDQSEEDARRFLKNKKISYPILMDKKQKTPEQYGVVGMPTAFMLDRQGLLRETHTGFTLDDVDKIAKIIQRLLDEKDSE